jgi:2,4-dienoyl-CoA reductase-like NADH-dependent reductase (Old Yellow Enzyme family)
MSLLFSPLTLRKLTFRNRVFLSPMCQYSSEDGLPNDWHLVHLGARAQGGAALVMVEATAVTPEGRISLNDSGIWSDAHAAAFQPITRFARSQGAIPGVQLSHAGRKASVEPPFRGNRPLKAAEGGWQPEAPSALPFAPGHAMPRAMSTNEMDALVDAFRAATKRASAAGFEVVEVHFAHGYLLHEFLSPLSNRRDDDYGGSLENRMRLPLRVAEAVRAAWPADLPVLVRISASDWVEGGLDLAQSLVLAGRLKDLGIDLIDCSSGGLVANAAIPVGPGYQTPFAAAIRREVGIPTATVGLITDPAQAEHILVTGQADAVSLAREMLRNPYWPLQAAAALGADIEWPIQYRRAKIR